MSRKKKSTPKSISIQRSYIGPIPPPADLGIYEQVLPGAADRILTMAEEQQDHSHKISSREQLFYHGGRLASYFIVLAVALASIVAGTFLILEGHSATGISFILGALGSFAGAIIYTKSKE